MVVEGGGSNAVWSRQGNGTTMGGWVDVGAAVAPRRVDKSVGGRIKVYMCARVFVG